MLLQHLRSRTVLVMALVVLHLVSTTAHALPPGRRKNASDNMDGNLPDQIQALLHRYSESCTRWNVFQQRYAAFLQRQQQLQDEEDPEQVSNVDPNVEQDTTLGSPSGNLVAKKFGDTEQALLELEERVYGGILSRCLLDLVHAKKQRDALKMEEVEEERSSPQAVDNPGNKNGYTGVHPQAVPGSRQSLYVRPMRNRVRSQAGSVRTLRGTARPPSSSLFTSRGFP